MKTKKLRTNRIFQQPRNCLFCLDCILDKNFIFICRKNEKKLDNLSIKPEDCPLKKKYIKTI